MQNESELRCQLTAGQRKTTNCERLSAPAVVSWGPKVAVDKAEASLAHKVSGAFAI